MTKRFVAIALILASLVTPAFADGPSYSYGQTPQLTIPRTGYSGWGPLIESAFKSLTDFNAIYANPDGTLKTSTTATPWQSVTSSVTYVSASSFSVSSSLAAYFEIGRKVWLVQATQIIGSVSSISTVGGTTTVTLANVVLYSDNFTPGSVANPITSVSVSMSTPRSTPADNYFRNAIINGVWDVWQRGTAFTGIASGTYFADRWVWGNTSSAVVDASRSTTVPTSAQAGRLFNYSGKFAVTTADAAVAAGDAAFIIHKIEGYNFTPFVGQPGTLSFWVYATKIGTHCVAFRNSGLDRSYVAEYTVSSTLTWEKKTITVPFTYSGGTWDYTNGVGLSVTFTLMGGSTFQTTANAWQNGNYVATTNQVNDMDTNGNVFQITGVQFEPGAVATTFEYETFQQTLAKCQRYYWKSFTYATAPAQNAGVTNALSFHASVAGVGNNFGPSAKLPVTMRAAPTVTYYNPSAANAFARNFTRTNDSSAMADSNSSTEAIIPWATGIAGWAIGDWLLYHATASAEL